MSDMVGGGDSAKGSMQHRWKLYASVQPYLLRFVPADVRSYSAFLFHLVLHVISSLTLLLLSPFLYLIERYHAHRITLPLPYRHILITGASSGVGEGLAYHLASSSTRLVLVARNTEQLHLVADKCRAKGADVVEAVQDVEDQAGMERVIADAEAVRALDVVFAVAGREATMGGEEDIVSASRSVVSTNVLGALNTILPCVPYMRARRRGQLVFFSSQLGFLAAPLATDYDSAKVCIRLYGEGLRTLLHSSNIAVNVIVPGGMVTTNHSLASPPTPLSHPCLHHHCSDSFSPPSPLPSPFSLSARSDHSHDERADRSIAVADGALHPACAQRHPVHHGRLAAQHGGHRVPECHDGVQQRRGRVAGAGAGRAAVRHDDDASHPVAVGGGEGVQG